MELVGGASEACLHPEEAALVSSAHPRRQAEFAGGRLCARAALAAWNVRDFPLLSAADRAPRWPATLVGSITHTDGYCGTVVGPRVLFRGIGVDAEQRGSVREGLWRYILTEQEWRWIAARSASERAELATLVFSAKEAFYKCQYCVTRAWLDFHDVAIVPNGEGGLVARPTRPLPTLGEETHGRYAYDGERVYTGFVLSAGCRSSASRSRLTPRAGPSPRRRSSR
jgi:4'-phosphopantetheinyl transferase EntD